MNAYSFNLNFSTMTNGIDLETLEKTTKYFGEILKYNESNDFDKVNYTFKELMSFFKANYSYYSDLYYYFESTFKDYSSFNFALFEAFYNAFLYNYKLRKHYFYKTDNYRAEFRVVEDYINNFGTYEMKEDLKEYEDAFSTLYEQFDSFKRS